MFNKKAGPEIINNRMQSLPSLKGQCREIFCFWFFSLISFGGSIPLGPYQNFLRKFAEIFVSQGAHRYRFTTSFTSVVDDTSGRFAAGVNDTSGYLPPVIATGINNTGGKQWEYYQAADTLK